MTPLKKVRKGDPLNFPASAFNAFVGAAEFTEAMKRSGGRHFTPQVRQAGIVRVKNDSGADRDRFNILGIDAPIFTPTDNEDTFKNQVALTGVEPDEDYHVGKFAILLEPIPDGKIGLACLDGVCPVKIGVEDEDHEYADVADAEAGKLRSCPLGAGQILWKESGTGEKWAVVRLGVPPSPFEVVKFAGVCKIDEENPDTAYANVAVIQNDFTNGPAYLGIAYPDTGKREWVLIKFQQPVVTESYKTKINFEASHAVQWKIDNNSWTDYPAEVGMHFGVDLVTQDFEFEGDECATWDTKPAVTTARTGQLRIEGDQFHERASDDSTGIDYDEGSSSLHKACIISDLTGPLSGITIYGLQIRIDYWYELGWGVRLWEAHSTLTTAKDIGCVELL